MTRKRKDVASYPAEKARQGEIILKERWQRIVFMTGLAGAVLLIILFWLYWGQ